MAKYLVGMTVSAYVDYEVEANSEEEAREKAYNEIDTFEIDDWNIRIEDVNEIDD